MHEIKLEKRKRMKYDFAAIEKKWQKRWEETKPYAAVTGDARPKFYGLIEFPYPSGDGLHVGHRYLIETAAKQVERLYVFVVEEDKSFFKFDDRYEMVKAGVEDLKNIVLI